MADPYHHRGAPLHRALGGGSVADVVLWRNKCGAIVLLISASAFWYIFECAGYSFISFLSNVLFLLVSILFFWAKSASVLNRPRPPLPDLEVSEQTVEKIACVVQVWVNKVLSIAHDIAIGRNLKRLFQVVFSLWLISYIGSLFNFFTLLYTGILLCLSVTPLFEKYQDIIDAKLDVIIRNIHIQYRKIDDSILKKIPLSSNKQKKIE